MPPRDAATERVVKTRRSYSTRSMSSHVKPGSLAPHCDDATLDTTSGRVFKVSSAASAAMLRPGNEPDMPTATTSPSTIPARFKRCTITAAKLGFTAVCFAARWPVFVVMGDMSSPTRPDSLGSLSGSSSSLRRSRSALMVSYALRARDAASIFSR